MKKLLTLKNLLILAIIILCSYVYYLSNRNNSLSSIVYTYRTTPEVNLTNTLYLQNGVLEGEALGFVRFLNPVDQPKNINQYMEISPIPVSTDLGNQIVLVRSIIKLDAVAPKELDSERYFITEADSNYVFMKNDQGAEIKIWLSMGGIDFNDAMGDKTILITNPSSYADFKTKKK